MKFYEVLLLILAFRIVEEFFTRRLRRREMDEYMSNWLRFVGSLYREGK